MNEQDVRALVREAIERHLGRPDGATKVAPYRIDDKSEAAYRIDQRSEAPYRIEHRSEAHIVRNSGESPYTRSESPDPRNESSDARRARFQSSYDHPSHILLKVPPGSDLDDGTCVIEPQVRCNHCGFCQSFGH